jgi:hypothetical protein
LVNGVADPVAAPAVLGARPLVFKLRGLTGAIAAVGSGNGRDLNVDTFAVKVLAHSFHVFGLDFDSDPIIGGGEVG